MIEKLQEGIYRVKIPFETIYTTAFFLIDGAEGIVLDSGSNAKDAQKYVIPAVEQLGFFPRYLVSTHDHTDHHGGMEALKKAYPEATPALFSQNVQDSYHLTDGELLLGRFQAVHLPGHCEDASGILDTKTNTLFSGDSLQMYGLDRYRTLVGDYDTYFQTIEKVRNMKVDTIIASHEYEPLGFRVSGKQVEEFLDICKIAAEEKRKIEKR